MRITMPAAVRCLAMACVAPLLVACNRQDEALASPAASFATPASPVFAAVPAPGVPPATGWILVDGSVEDVAAAVRDYAWLFEPRHHPVRFRVELHPQDDGKVAVLLPDGLPTYHLPNFTTWLSAPPEQEQVEGAVGWMTAPDGKRRYYLEPELANPAGDTVIASDAGGRQVRVWLPTGAVSALSSTGQYRPQPEILRSATPVVLELVYDKIDIACGFGGNPRFVPNRPADLGPRAMMDADVTQPCAMLR